MTENTKQLLYRAAQYLTEPYHPVTDDKYKVGVELITDLSRELAATTEPKVVTVNGSPIHKAIRDLRDAIESGEGWKVICAANSALFKLIAESGDINLIWRYDDLSAKLMRGVPTNWPALFAALTALEQVVGGETGGVQSAAKRWKKDWNRWNMREVDGDEPMLVNYLPSSPTPSLTSRIQAAAEEIARRWPEYQGQFNTPRYDHATDIAAIITEYVEGKES